MPQKLRPYTWPLFRFTSKAMTVETQSTIMYRSRATKKGKQKKRITFESVSSSIVVIRAQWNVINEGEGYQHRWGKEIQ